MDNQLEHSHNKKDIKERIASPHQQNYLRDWIYGGIDGAVTTFAIVSGVVGGHLSALVILILGFANLFADGFSMAVSNYIGTKSEEDQYYKYKSIEAKHIDLAPEGEKAEIREIFKQKGLSGTLLDLVVDEITSNKTLWIKTMLQEEYGLPQTPRNPVKAGMYTFFAFLLFGLIPLVPYVLKLTDPFFWSCFSTGVTFFIIGSIKSLWSVKPWYYSGMQTLMLGSATATLAYLIGRFLHAYLA
ncbi:VIT1/CCC1 transporter family protein [Legionella londiniensis]|uniref:Integral membrane protein n=1 Tax=Legionella londiniensis TaxID=45068 RepID=A0A0W0VP16_9GAMM|nr:VIT1/CCC1 transporter family protein [Legionella londiniensis]KTD21820.1 integral membrane protein [Legionella londiniensis]STX92697.1 integral membrane protein [Legionella londiniensis]